LPVAQAFINRYLLLVLAVVVGIGLTAALKLVKKRRSAIG